MPELACNYSPALLDLLDSGRVQLDWIKLSRWDVLEQEFSLARPVRPVLLHVFPHASMVPHDGIPWDAYNDALERCGSPHAALHLKADPADFPEGETDSAIVHRLSENARIWARQIRVPLLLENVPYSGGRRTSGRRGTLRQATDPGVIEQVCVESGAGLLLDIAHARVAAWNRREDPRTYLASLPLHLVREIHTSGPLKDEEGMRDWHGELSGEDFELLQWALVRTRARIVTLEYGGTGPVFESRTDPAALERQLVRLRTLLWAGATEG